MLERGVASIERPVLAMEVLRFLNRNDKACMTEMISEGWNKTTLTSTLRRLRNAKLVDIDQGGSFPRFEKSYELTQKGEYVSHFVIHLKGELKSSLGIGIHEFSRLPKGCMPVLAFILRKGYPGISGMIEELGISPHQAYRCLFSMESMGIVYKEMHRSGKREVLSFRLSEAGFLVAVAVDALDKALRTWTNSY